jgi:PAS domain S-box-containing protein
MALEHAAQSSKQLEAVPPDAREQTLHELRVYQIELEMQNEELRRTQVALEAARDRYVDLYDFSPAGHLTLDTHGTIVEANLRAATLLGINRDKLIGQPLAKLIAPRDADTFHRHDREVLKTGTRQTCEVQLREGTGASRWVSFESLAVHEESGRSTQWRTALLDITGRKRAEQKLELQRVQLEGVIGSAMDAIITVNDQQQITLFNHAAERMFHCSLADAIGTPLEQFIPSRFRTAHHRQVVEFGRSGTTSRKMGNLSQVRGLRADGTEFPLEASISHINVEGKPYFTVILRDVTERDQLNAQLRKAERLAELGTLASGMAHEIGTPMNVILGRAEYLRDRATDEPVRKGLTTIVTQVERITKLMHQLLAFARRNPPVRGPLALKDIVDNSLELFQERLAKSRVTAEVVWDDSCPKVLADPDQMSQVMINLIMNAIHAMPDGGTVRIGLAPEEDRVKLTVADTGDGIPQEAIAKIFEPFFTTKEFGKGTGLGLTVVKGIIEEHHGSIAVESEPGKGTTFTMLLPKSL